MNLSRWLDREKTLFRDMFERRKSLAYRKEFALEVVDYKRERIQYLIDLEYLPPCFQHGGMNTCNAFKWETDTNEGVKYNYDKEAQRV